MKKARFMLPLLAIVLATASAFTARVTKDIEYYTLDGETFLEKETGGHCGDGSLYCTYIANTENPDPNTPADFDPVGSPDKVWIP